MNRMHDTLPQSISRPGAGRSRILYVDDDAFVREMGQQVLGRSGYEVDTAADGDAAWDALHAREYQLLITDQNMPRRTGAELVMQIRQDGIGVPVVITSEAWSSSLMKGARPQVAAVLPKPFVAKELLEAVRQVLERATGVGPAEMAIRSMIRKTTHFVPSYRHWGINE